MAGENDQCKWVGVRPTNPPENIPVTESDPVTSMDVTEQSPLTSIKVEPKLAGTTFKTVEQSPLVNIKVEPKEITTVFKTSTEKRSPAMCDMQAPSSFVRINMTELNVGIGTYNWDIYTVPAGYVFMTEFNQAMCFQADPTGIQFILRSGGVDYIWYNDVYGGAFALKATTLKITYDEAEIVRHSWINCLAGTDVMCWLFGTLYKKY